jgi:uncharacterized LabA/DUF88 family protein
MAENIDAEFLISLIEARPVLWDKTLDVFKDRIATRNAWREVCLELKPDFEELEERAKNAFGKYQFFLINYVKYNTYFEPRT